MVGDAEVLESEIDCGAGHLDQRILPIARRRVAVEGTAQITPLNENRKFSGLGSRDLSLVLAKLGRDEIEIQRLVELLLIADCGGLLRPLGHGEAVLVERPTAIQSTATETDVVLLAPCEIDERERILLGFHHTEIALHPILEADARFRGAVDNDFLHQRMVDEELRNLLRSN